MNDFNTLNIQERILSFIEDFENEFLEKSPYTWQHSLNVSEISVSIAKKMKFNNKTIKIIEIGALLHDIGKANINDNIVNKPSSLTKEEYDNIKRHAKLTKRLLLEEFKKEKGSKFINKIICIGLFHHERWDGNGYPYGLKEKRIPITARIVTLADCIDAMMAKRPYKQPMEREVVVQEIKKNAGKQFDPEIVDIFLKNLDDILSIYNEN